METQRKEVYGLARYVVYTHSFKKPVYKKPDLGMPKILRNPGIGETYPQSNFSQIKQSIKNYINPHKK